jgi:NDP-sugar pyrophosphorylase family protein
MPIGEKAILEIQVEQLVRYGFDQIFLATNYKADYIEKFLGDGSRYGAKLIVSKEEKPLGTAGPVKLLENQIAEPFLVMNGDILSLVDFGKFYNFSVSQDSLFTVGIKKIIMPYAFGNIHFEGDRVTSIEEKPNIVTYALAGIYVMKPGIFSLIPENEYFGIDNLIQVMLARNLAVTKYEIKEYWIDIGRVDDYEKIQEISDTFANK